MIRSLLILFSCTAFLCGSSQTKPSIIVDRGDQQTISPRSYDLDTLWVKESASLLIEGGGKQWLVLNCNVAIIDGSVTYRGMENIMDEITAKTKDGFQLSYRFPMTAKGGNGGDGGGNGSAVGGLGAISTTSKGGGGGSGAQGEDGTQHEGRAGREDMGASGPFYTKKSSGGKGGNGVNRNGGLLCINALEFKNGPSAVIDVSGKPGISGAAGEPGSCNRYEVHAGGGGGGGSAGGDGGVIIIRSKTTDATAPPETRVSPGEGGKGGPGGDVSECPQFAGRSGIDGEPGTQGYIDYLNR